MAALSHIFGLSCSSVQVSVCSFLPNPNSCETNGARHHRRKKIGIKSEAGKQEITEKEKRKKRKKNVYWITIVLIHRLWLLKASAHKVSFNHNCFYCLHNKSIHNCMQVEWAHWYTKLSRISKPTHCFNPQCLLHTCILQLFPSLASFCKYFKTNSRITSR